MPAITQAFFDPVTATVTYVVHEDAPGGACAIIDSVLDYDPKSGRTSTAGADRVIEYVRQHGLRTDWLLETHAHADHLSAAPTCRSSWAASSPSAAPSAPCKACSSASSTGAGLRAGRLAVRPPVRRRRDLPHRRAGSHRHPRARPHAGRHGTVGDAAFVGDTLFMPDVGTARCDFPGGDARQLYRSIRRLLDLPAATRLYMCHDYPPAEREARWQTTVAEQRQPTSTCATASARTNSSPCAPGATPRWACPR